MIYISFTRKRLFVTKRFFKAALQCAFIWMCFPLCTVYAAVYFNGFSGTAVRLGQDAQDSLLNAGAATFFSGQLDWSNIFTLRAALTLNTPDTTVLSTDIYSGIPSFLRLDELSLTAKIHANDLSHYVSLYLGDFEPPGSSLFMQRQFGAYPAESFFLQNAVSNDGAAMYSAAGMGLSYTLKFQQPMAARLSLYAKRYKTAFDLNADIRYAGVWQQWSLDALIGVTFPVEKIDSGGQDVFMLINTADLHAVVSALIGSGYSHSLFMQIGISRLRLKPLQGEKVFSVDNLNFIFEPRFMFGSVRCNFTLFNLAEDQAQELFFVQNPLGVSCSVFSDLIRAGSRQITAGGHVILTGKDIGLSTLTELGLENLSLNITPFVSLPVFSGTFTGALTLDVLNITNFAQSFGIMANYKIYL